MCFIKWALHSHLQTSSSISISHRAHHWTQKWTPCSSHRIATWRGFYGRLLYRTWMLARVLEVFGAAMLSSSHVMIDLSTKALCGKQERKGYHRISYLLRQLYITCPLSAIPQLLNNLLMFPCFVKLVSVQILLHLPRPPPTLLEF